MSYKDVVASMENLDINIQDFATPNRSGTFAKVDDDTREHFEKLIKYMRKKLTAKKDMSDGIVYAAKAYGSEIGDKRYIKVGWSGQARDTRIKDIKRCEVSVEQYFHTPAFQGAYRAEQILLKLFRRDRRRRNFCKCQKKHHEWFDKDLGLVRHWVLTVYLWFRKEPYDFGNRELKPEWQDAVNRWENSFDSDRPIYLEEFLMLGPHFMHKSQLVVSLSSSKPSLARKKSSGTHCRLLAQQIEFPCTPSPTPRTITKSNNVSSSTKLQPTSQRHLQVRASKAQSYRKSNDETAINLWHTIDAWKHLKYNQEQCGDSVDNQSDSSESNDDDVNSNCDEEADRESDGDVERSDNEELGSDLDVSNDECDDDIERESGVEFCCSSNEQDENEEEEGEIEETSDLEYSEHGNDYESVDESNAEDVELEDNNDSEQNSDEVESGQHEEETACRHSSIEPSQQDYHDQTNNEESGIMEDSKTRRHSMGETSRDTARSEGSNSEDATDEDLDERKSTSPLETESNEAASGNDATGHRENFTPDEWDKSGCINLGSLSTEKGVQEERSLIEVAGNKNHGEGVSGCEHNGNQLLGGAIRIDNSRNGQPSLDDLIIETTKLSLDTTQLDPKDISLKWIREFTIEHGHIPSPRAEILQSTYPANRSSLTEVLSAAELLSDSLSGNSTKTTSRPDHGRSVDHNGSQTDAINESTELDSTEMTEKQQHGSDGCTHEVRKSIQTLTPIEKTDPCTSFNGVNGFKYEFRFRRFKSTYRVLPSNLCDFGPILTPCSRRRSGSRSLQGSTDSTATFQTDSGQWSSNASQNTLAVGGPFLSAKHEHAEDRDEGEVPWYLRLSNKAQSANEKPLTESVDESTTCPAPRLGATVPDNITSLQSQQATRSLPVTTQCRKPIIPSVLDAARNLTQPNDPLTLHFAKVWPVAETAGATKRNSDAYDVNNIFAPQTQELSSQPNVEQHLTLPPPQNERRKVAWKNKFVVIKFPPP